MFSSQLPLQSLIELCRALRHNLGAGLSLRKVFEQQSERGPRDARPVAGRIAATLEKGDDLRTALQQEQRYFPRLFLALAGVGEETGHLPEIFGELEKHYLLQQKMRRQFRSQSMLPILQLLAAIFIIAFLIFVLGVIADTRQSKPLITIFGQSGATGAILFLAMAFGTLAVGLSGFLLLRRTAAHKAGTDALLLRLPAIGPCLQALSLGRFAIALRLTMECGMPMARALRLSLTATGNAAYEATAENVTQAVKKGESVASALPAAGVFPQEFLDIVATAEEGGRVPEMMQHQADYYAEEASRRMGTLTKVMGIVVWLVVAGIIITAIFRIANIYLGALGG